MTNPVDRTQPPLVLVVDDDEDTVGMLSLFLAHSGFRVTSALGGEEALNSARASVPDVVVADVAMPRMDGAELCRRLKADARTAHVPIIAVTGFSAHGRKEDEHACFEAFLLKPCSPDVVLAKVRETLVKTRELGERNSHLRADAARLCRETKETLLAVSDTLKRRRNDPTGSGSSE